MEGKGDDRQGSISSVTSFNGTHKEYKYTKMKKLVTAIENYLETRAEDKSILINQYLQALSLSLDLTIFDPHTNIATKFFISLYDLMNVLDTRSLTSWYCIDVLLNVCKNDSARRVLLKTYQFLPCLARLIGDQLTTEKKTRLLKLMQDITCGIKIFWQIPHLTHLMFTLCKWIEVQEADIVTLSLGVLVNLCYKNATTVYILQRHVDLKRFIRICLSLKGPIVEVYVCQMMIILENISGYIPPEVLPKLIDSTFIAVMEAYKKNDHILLKQIVEFFTESLKNNRNNQLNCYDMYGERVNNIVEMIDSPNEITKDPECLSVVLDFIHFLIELKVPEISSLYTKMIPLALAWIQETTVSYQALALLRTIAVTVDKKENTILESLIVGLPMFSLVLHSLRNDDGSMYQADHNKRLGALLQLLAAMIQVKSIRTRVTKELNEDIFTKILSPLMGDESPRLTEHTCSIEAVNLYVYALALVAEIVEFDRSWCGFMNHLLGKRQIQVILAQAIFQSPPDAKQLALELSNRPFSSGVSLALTELEAIISSGNNSGQNVSSPQPNEFSFTLVPVKQNERLDVLLESIQNVSSTSDAPDAATSQLMELYNYKISSLAHAERAALSSVEAVTKHCTHLQHRILRLTQEITSLQQSEFYKIQQVEEISRQKKESDLTLRDLQNRFEAEKGKLKACQSQLKISEKTRGELESELSEMTKLKNDSEEQLSKLQKLYNKVEENCRRHEKNALKKEELLNNANATIASKSMQIKDLENSLTEIQRQLDDTITQLQVKSSILASITNLATSQH